MLCGYGLLPPGRMQRDAVERTLRRVLETWDFTQMWGWDFGVMAMTATALGLPELAVELLLRQTEKNYYTVSGNNRQISVPALPLYLPGNGSLLLAVAMMARGTSFTQGSTPGFPKNGEWQVKWEQLRPLY